MTQQTGYQTAGGLIYRTLRPLRVFARIFMVGSIGAAAVAVWLLAHSWAGVVISAESPPGAAITMPAANTDTLVVYAVRPPGPRPDVTCKLATTSSSWVGMNFDLIHPTSKGRSLEPVAKVFAGWHVGDTLTCTGEDVTTIVLGRNVGLTYLLQGLLFLFLAIGSGIFALVGFASRRYQARTLATQSGVPLTPWTQAGPPTTQAVPLSPPRDR